MEYRMSFSDGEWNQLMTAPEVAAFYISLSSPSNMFGVVKEMMASTNQIVEAIRNLSGNSLVNEVASDIKLRVDQGIKIDSPVITGTPETREEACLEFFRDLSTLLSQKAPDQEEGFEKWVFTAAKKASEAATEGGFMGFGGEKVNAAEQDALKKLALALGIEA